MKKDRADNMDYAKLLKQKEERLKRLQTSKNPFLLCIFSFNYLILSFLHININVNYVNIY
jgi:hypothetical protein